MPGSSSLWSPFISDDTLQKYNRQRSHSSRLCYAPFHSLAFYQDGRATACCFNREHTLGRYPAQSIQQIWQGEAAVRLRQAVQQHNLDLGCFDCKRHLLTGNYSGVKALNYDYLGAANAPHGFPLLIDFLLDNACNLECQMCSGVYSSSIRKNRERLPADAVVYDERFIEELGAFIPYLKWANFSGGEPFLITAYHAIWDKIAALNPDILCGVTTNGTVLNARVKDWLQKLRFHLSISIDSLNKQRFETIRKNASLERVLENFTYFRDYAHAQGTAITINMTVMVSNWMDVPDMVRFASENGAQIYFTNVWQPPAYALWNKPAATLADIAAFLEKNRPLPDSDIARTNDVLYAALLHDIKTWQQNAVQAPTDALLAETRFLQGLADYVRGNYPAPQAALSSQKYRAQIAELKHRVDPEWWQKGICIAATYPPELWAGELEVSNTPEKLLYSFLNFTGYYTQELG